MLGMPETPDGVRLSAGYVDHDWPPSFVTSTPLDVRKPPLLLWDSIDMQCTSLEHDMIPTMAPRGGTAAIDHVAPPSVL
jgi:hypothetical protein